MDMTTRDLWNYSTRYVLVLMAIDTRRIVHVAVTAHPTIDWVQQQIREATTGAKWRRRDRGVRRPARGGEECRNGQMK